MTTPRSVMTDLMRLKNAHLKRLRRTKPGLAIHFEREIDQILDRLPASDGLPAYLSLDEQGRFLLGYHHERSHRPTDTSADDKAIEVDSLTC